MKLVALHDGVGRLEPDGSVAVLDVVHPGLAALVSAGELGVAAGATVKDRRPSLAGGGLVGPTATVWGIGMNYASKQQVTGRDAPSEPTLFVKASGSVVPGGPIELPPVAPDAVDFEGEIAVLLDRDLLRATSTEALEAVAGVAAADDVTARDVLRATGNPTLAKSFRGFGQFGSVMLCRDELRDIAALELATRVNGQLRQSDTSAGMLLGVGDLLAHLSRYVHLRPGDVVLTGTPAGTGDEDGRYLRVGDVVEVTVADLPALRSSVVAGDAVEPTRGV